MITGQTEVFIPPDPILRSTIEQIARQCVTNPAIEEMLRKASSGDKHLVLLKGKEFVVDATHEGHQYFKYCVESARRQQPPPIITGYQMTANEGSSFQSDQPPPPFFSSTDFSNFSDISNLINQYQEPTPHVGSDVAILTATSASTLTSLLSPLISSLSSSTTLSAWIEIVGSIPSDALLLLTGSSHSPSTKAWSLKKAVEASSDFWGRMSRVIVLYRLIHIDQSIRSSLLPYFVWVLRLVYIVAYEEFQKNAVMELLKRFRYCDNLIDNDEVYNHYIQIITCKHLPSPVDPVYNPENKRRSRFDLSSPSRGPSPKRLKTLPTPTIPSNPIVPQFSTAQFSHIPSFIPQWSSLPSIQPAPPSGPPPTEATLSESPLDPDKIPVGILATMLKSISKRGRNIQAAFVPYRPLDSLLTPSSFPTPQPMTEYIIDRLNDLQDDIDLEFKKIESEERRRPLEQLKNGCYDDVATNPDYDYGGKPPKRERKKHPPRGFKDDGGFTSRCEASWEKPLAWAQAEMGVEDDGTLINAGSKGEDRLGIGAAGGERLKSAAQDIFNSYRKNKSKKYHQVIAAAQAGRWGVDEDKVCYICQKPGHFARECKFGLT